MIMHKNPLVGSDGQIIDDLFLITPSIFHDNRGYFYESWNQKKFDQLIGKSIKFLQDNHSFSKQGVVRGLHYQLQPFQQSKLVMCISGEIFDVAVDLRKNSRTFGSWVGVILNDKNQKKLWIPEGFAHGFLVMSSSALVIYKVDQYWKKDYEKSIRWDDEYLKIKWPEVIDKVLISEKDSNSMNFLDLNENQIFSC
tara:strand:- start:114 stop:701 length:588 start_codon:yes stop_codon:yes gene_type:complete